MSENSLWQTLRDNMRWQEATRHEDMTTDGIADLSFVADRRHGWIELKFLAEWPKRAGTVVSLRHFTDAQRGWLKRKGRAGGNTWLLLQVGDGGRTGTWYGLFHWDRLEQVGTSQRDVLTATANHAWDRRLNYVELLQALVGPEFSM